MNGFEWLESLSRKMKAQVANGEVPEKFEITVRDFMLKFDYYRRSPRINRRVLNKLDDLNLKTVPSFDKAWFEDAISIELDRGARFDGGAPVETDTEDGVPAPAIRPAETDREDSAPVPAIRPAETDREDGAPASAIRPAETDREDGAPAPTIRPSDTNMEDGAPDDDQDPTIRIKNLDAANQELVSVNPNDRLSAAVAKMQLNDFSQLPVMQGERRVEGVVSWKSISARTSLGLNCEFVRQCMDPAEIIEIDTPLLDAADDIQRHGYVLVRDKVNKISGIVTASDIAEQLMQLSAPFLLVGEIEGRLRRLIRGKLTTEQLRGSALNAESAKSINGPDDLTLGEYVQLLGKPENWDSLDLNGIDRKEFVKFLNSVREIRNEVMHFDPEGLDPEQKRRLRNFANYFRDLESMGAV